jgi:hypothetical protein
MNYKPNKEEEKELYPAAPSQPQVPEQKQFEAPKIDTGALKSAADVKAAEVAQPELKGYANLAKNEFKPYTPGDTVTKAQTALDNHVGVGTPQYKSAWDTQINDIVNQIMNREKFSYDVNEDALYDQYADIYKRNAELMAADTTGRAAKMTGGYGNSWASTVGASAFAGEMQKLNDKIPELWELAYSMYNNEGQDLYNKYGLLADREDEDYGRFRDEVSDFNTERDYLAGRYDAERGFDYGVFGDDRAYEFDERWKSIGRRDDITAAENDAAMKLYGYDVDIAEGAADREQTGVISDNNAALDIAGMESDDYWTGEELGYKYAELGQGDEHFNKTYELEERVHDDNNKLGWAQHDLEGQIAYNDATHANDEFEHSKNMSKASLYAQGGNFEKAAELLGVDAATVEAAYKSDDASKAANQLGFKDVYELGTNIDKLVNGYRDSNEKIPAYGSAAVAEMYATSDLTEEQFAAVLKMIQIADPEFDPTPWLDSRLDEHPE